MNGKNIHLSEWMKVSKDKVPNLLDNVVDTGTTAKAAVKALGGGIVLSYVMSDTLLERREYHGLHR